MRLGYKEIFGGHATRQGIIERLRRYSLGEILDYFGRVSAVVYNATYAERAKVQAQLCAGLFGDTANRVWSAVQREAKTDRSEVVLFDEVPIGLGIKFALHALDAEAKPTGTPPLALAEALLMINNLVDETALTPTGHPLTTETGWNKWVYYQYVLAVSTANDNPVQSIARAYDLFLTGHSLPYADLARLSLPDLVEKTTGLKPSRYWTILWAFLSYFYTINASNAHDHGAWISRSRYFDQFGFTTEEVNNFFAFVASDVDEIRRQLGAHFSLSDTRPHDLLPLARTPLVAIGDRVYCPYLRLLFDRMTGGLYHVLLNAESATTTEGNRARSQFQSHLGDVYEDYVDRLFRRVVQHGNAKFVYIGPSELRFALAPTVKGREPPVCDHVLVYEDKAVLMDSKAKFLPMRVRFGLDETEFVRRASDLFISAARQLDSTIEHIRAGKLDSHGFRGNEITRFYPVIVSLADFPFQPLTYQWVHRKIEEHGYLRPTDVRPLEILTAGDIDSIEAVMSNGHSLADLLEDKLRNPAWARHSFHNFVVLSNDSLLTNARSPYLEEVYLRITAEAEGILKQARKQPPKQSI